MSATALLVVCLVACGSRESREPPAADKPHRPILRLVYDVELDTAVDDKLDDVRRELDAALADRKLPAEVTRSTTGVTVTPRDPSTSREVDEATLTDYASTLEKRDCPAPLQLCYALSPVYADAVKKTALESAVKTIRARIDAKGIADPNVMQRADQIVVELPGADPQSMMIRGLIARVGKLEFKVVSDDSELMRRIYAHAHGEPPGDVTVDVDSWQGDDGTRHTDYYLVAQDRKLIADYLAKLATVDARFRVPDDHQIAYELVESTDKPAHWRTYYVERTARITGASVSAATGTTDPNTNRPIVNLEFTRAGAHLFAEITESIVGRKLAIVFDDQIRSAPIINGPIRGGRASITMGGADPRAQEADRDALVSVLKSGALPAPLHEVSSTVVK